MGKNPASAFYYPGPLFHFENCEQTTRITKGWKKKKKTCPTFNSQPISPSKKKKLFCPLGLTIHFAAQNELSVRVPTYQTNLRETDQRKS